MNVQPCIARFGMLEVSFGLAFRTLYLRRLGEIESYDMNRVVDK
jgi:hypothetical protein